MFAKIKEAFLCFLERRKWAKFKKNGLSKLPPSVFETAESSFLSIDGQVINTHYEFKEDGTETPVEFKTKIV